MKYITAKHKTGLAEFSPFQPITHKHKVIKRGYYFFSAASDRNNLKSQSYLENIKDPRSRPARKDVAFQCNFCQKKMSSLVISRKHKSSKHCVLLYN